VGLWVGGSVELVISAILVDQPLTSILTVGFFSFIAAVIYAVPIAAIAALLIFPLARWGQGKLSPTLTNASVLGGLVGVAFTALAFDFSLIVAGMAGGVAAGITYRAMLIYRHPELLSQENRAGSIV
jgi:hypothetical protein